jgi:hypothetical protein
MLKAPNGGPIQMYEDPEDWIVSYSSPSRTTSTSRIPTSRTTGRRADEVGISSKPPQRWGQHAADKEWWPEVADLSLEWLESRAAALDAESRAIRTEKPLHNVLHNNAA